MSDREDYDNSDLTPLIPHWRAKKGKELKVLSNVESAQNSDSSATNDDSAESSSEPTRPRQSKHKAQKDRARKKSEARESGACFSCGSPDHKIAHCPKRHGGVRRPKAEAAVKKSLDKMSEAEGALGDMKKEIVELRKDFDHEKEQIKDYKAEIEDLKDRFAVLRARRLSAHRVYYDRRFVAVDLLPWIAACVFLCIYLLSLPRLVVVFRPVALGSLEFEIPLIFAVGAHLWRVAAGTLGALFTVCMLYAFPWRVFRAEIFKVCDAETLGGEIQDLRFDANALQDIKHRDPIWAKVYYTLHVAGVCLPWYRKGVWVSLERFAQAMSPANQELDVDDPTLLRRIKMSIRTIHAVNDDRYRAFDNPVSCDTAALAYTVLRHFAYERRFYLMGGLHAPFTHPKELPRY